MRRRAETCGPAGAAWALTGLSVQTSTFASTICSKPRWGSGAYAPPQFLMLADGSDATRSGSGRCRYTRRVQASGCSFSSAAAWPEVSAILGAVAPRRLEGSARFAPVILAREP